MGTTRIRHTAPSAAAQGLRLVRICTPAAVELLMREVQERGRKGESEVHSHNCGSSGKLVLCELASQSLQRGSLEWCLKCLHVASSATAWQQVATQNETARFFLEY